MTSCSASSASAFPEAPPSPSVDHVLSGTPVARLRPTGRKDSVEVLYWSAWQERWAATGPFGRTILSLDEAPPLHRARGYLLGVVLTLHQSKKRKVELRLSLFHCRHSK